MNIFGKLLVHSPKPGNLLIDRNPGLIYWISITIYSTILSFFVSLFAVIIWDFLLPRTLSCYKSDKNINCIYETGELLNSKTVNVKNVKNVKKAIISKTVNGEIIVLTSSNPWVALEPTTDVAQNIKIINQSLAKLNREGNDFKLNLDAPKGAQYFIIFCLLPIGILLLLSGVYIVWRQGLATLELDADLNTVSIIRFGRLRSKIARFSQLIEADSKPMGYLGILSDKFGIYGGDRRYRFLKYRILRLLFTDRQSFVFCQQRFTPNEEQTIIATINEFIAKHQK